MRTGGIERLEPAECLRLLGLPEAASVAQIKRAYHLLAQRLHPDKSRGDEAARNRFIVVSNAYRSLMKAARLAKAGQPVGTCCMCREFGEVVVGLDGRARCPGCALRPGGRLLLPLPTFVIVRCISVFVLLGTSVYLLFRAVQTRDFIYAAGGAAAGLAALSALALICLRVVYCMQPGEDSIRRAALRREKSSRTLRR